jgi:hypothetical protein
MEMDEKVIFLSPALFNYEQFYSHHPSHLSWFKIIRLTYQMSIGRGPNTRGVKGATPTDNPVGKTETFHQPNGPT